MFFSRHFQMVPFSCRSTRNLSDDTFKEPELLAFQLGEKIEKRRGWKRSIEAGRGGEDPLYT